MSVETFTNIAAKGTMLDVRDATRWYDEANDLAVHLTTLGNLTFDQACCIIATFSIRQRWAKNVELAKRFASGGRDLPVMGSINRIAENVVAFDDPYSALNGQKTNAFARNIAGDVMAVTIDVWMLKAAGVDHTKSPNKTVYNQIANDLRDAARIYGTVPSIFQAYIWIIIRGNSK